MLRIKPQILVFYLRTDSTCELDKFIHCCTIVIDTSALIAVIVDEPERNKIIELTTGNKLIGPGSIPWEIGNAFSAMFKQKRMKLDEAKTRCRS